MAMSKKRQRQFDSPDTQLHMARKGGRIRNRSLPVPLAHTWVPCVAHVFQCRVHVSRECAKPVSYTHLTLPTNREDSIALILSYTWQKREAEFVIARFLCH